MIFQLSVYMYRLATISIVLVTETWRVSRFVTCELPGTCAASAVY